MSDTCGDCPVASASRRAFLREVGLTVVGALALITVGSPAVALADSVVATQPLRAVGRRRTYGIPAGDSIGVDADSDVIIARWHDRVYAFSLKCPHRGTRLEWHADESRLFCPKHKARFQPDGAHDSGRTSRDLDRYDIKRQSEALVVDLDALRRADQDPEVWQSAMIVLA
jgi:nitrite reductase/ring-hydroxylating ferredoxin subunit